MTNRTSYSIAFLLFVGRFKHYSIQLRGSGRRLQETEVAPPADGGVEEDPDADEEEEEDPGDAEEENPGDF